MNTKVKYMAKAIYPYSHIRGKALGGKWVTFIAGDGYENYPYQPPEITKFKSKAKLLAELKRSGIKKVPVVQIYNYIY